MIKQTHFRELVEFILKIFDCIKNMGNKIHKPCIANPRCQTKISIPLTLKLTNSADFRTCWRQQQQFLHKNPNQDFRPALYHETMGGRKGRSFHSFLNTIQVQVVDLTTKGKSSPFFFFFLNLIPRVTSARISMQSQIQKKLEC